MKRLMKRLVLIASGAAVFAASAREWTVDVQGGGDYTTIQEAVDAASSGDTIWVKPGVYATGGRRTTESGGKDNYSRVLLTKPLTLVATSSDPADTHIVGAPDPTPVYEGKDYEGRGPESYRCIRLEQAAAQGGTVIRGFTLRDGYCAQRYNNDTYGADVIAGQPGGVTSPSATYGSFYVTDCVITNCYGVRGGLVRFGTYVRCRFSDGHGASGSSLGRNIRALSSLFVKMPGACADNSTFVNCTFADASGAPLHLNSGSLNNTVYNTICVTTGTQGYDAKAGNGTAKNSVFDCQPFATAENCHAGLDYQLFAPLRGDFRVRAGTTSATAGDAALVSQTFADAPTSVALYRSLDGSSFAATGAIPVGCYAKTAVAAGGAVQFDGANTVVCDGYAGTVGGLYAFSETPREVFRVRPPDGTAYFGFARADGQGGYQFPEMDESLCVAVPPAGVVVTNTAESVAKEYWVDPTSGSDSNDGTTSATPLKTLAKVASLLTTTGTRTLVHCAAGDYAEGSSAANASDVANRLTVADYRTSVRFKGEGRGKSFISGAADPSSTTGDGRGPNALRCVYLAGSSQGPCAVQGFTLRGGCSDAGDTSDSSTAKYKGGLVYFGASTRMRQIVDCELVGGCAYRGGISMLGVFTRDVFRDAKDLGGGALRGAEVRSSVFYGCTGTVVGSDTSLRQTTVSSTNGVGVLASQKGLTNIAFQAANCTADWRDRGQSFNVCYSFDNGKSVSGGTETSTSCARDLGFVNFAKDDLRLRSDSSLVTEPVPVDDGYWMAPASDVNGVAFSYRNGTTVAGGIFTPVPVLVVEKPAFGTATNVGTNVVEVGESLTVTFDASTATRLLDTMLVDGEPVAGTSFTYAPAAALAADGSPAPSATVSFLFATNWYVNATSGSDSNDGFTPETAWRTLAKIESSGLMLAGDCVHAAAGDYAEGSVVPGADSAAGSCRVSLPAGVTLVSDDGADATRIVGAADASASDTYGRGANAVRCAFLADGARLVGFTLADGRVSSTENGDASGTASGDVACVGGGVYATEMKNAFAANAAGGVFDCVFTNCVAGRGGAVFGTRLVNCKIYDCVGAACSPVGYKAALYGCVVDDVTRGTLTLFRNCYAVSHVTVGEGVKSGSFFDNLNAPKQIDNCVFLSKLTAFSGSSVTLVYSNCLVNAEEATFNALDEARRPRCVRIASADDAGLDAEGRPLGKTAKTVDAATTTDFVAATDVDGLPRVSNGAMDIGAFEFDWRPVYAADLGSLGKVVEADKSVVETTDQNVKISSGSLLLQINDDGQRGRYVFPLQVTGTGVLTIRAGETVLATFVAADGAQNFRYKTRTAGNALTFAYEPGASDVGGAVLAKASGGAGLLVVIR